jgi:hypothetical protein
LGVRQARAVQHHGQRIAQKGGVGEDVNLLEGACFMAVAKWVVSGIRG